MRRYAVIVLMCMIALASAGGAVFAQTSEQILQLKDEIASKKTNIDQINRKISSYKEKIDSSQEQVASLNGELDLLANRIAKTELDIKATEEEVGAVNAEITLLTYEITAQEQQLARDREILEELLRTMDEEDNSFQLRVLFGSESFSEIFDHLQNLEDVNGDLKKALDRAAQAKESVESRRIDQLAKKTTLTDLQKQLERSKSQLLDESNAKEVLVTQTQQSEAQFRSLLAELRQEQSYINYEIGRLQDEIEAKLDDSDQAGAPSALSWPFSAERGVSAYFHDPSYPFRHLFEHSGIDLPTSMGTPVKSAAPGYVAWAKTGTMYGNYIMVIHTNGLATLYAHLSRMDVTADQFVARGQVIGLSGGAAGAPGAGLSTGAHLHFEVRKNGIPTNPLDYLVN